MSRIEAAAASLAAELGRVDTKAAALSGIDLGALAVAGSLPGVPRPAVVAALVTVGVSLLLVLAALYPRLGGNHGLVRYARAATRRELVDAVTDDGADLIAVVGWRAQAAVGKYRLIRWSIVLLAVSPLVAAISGFVCR